MARIVFSFVHDFILIAGISSVIHSVMSDDEERSASEGGSEEEEDIMLAQSDVLSLDSTDEHSFVMPPKKGEVPAPQFPGNMLRDTKSTITGLITKGWVKHQ